MLCMVCLMMSGIPAAEDLVERVRLLIVRLPGKQLDDMLVRLRRWSMGWMNDSNLVNDL